MNERANAAIGSAAFFVAAPSVVAGLIPWLITHWRFPEAAPWQHVVIGWLLILVSLAALIECFARFATKGVGTPAPIAPTQHLVVTGLYRFVRNPMYLAVLGLIFGQMLVFQHAALLAYGVVIWFCFLVFILSYEEPHLRQRFPDEYAAYAAAVPRWLPRLKPWRAEEKAIAPE
jgi:protein-S-isoprenylcysteine O-methyltransferase Ste14